MFAPCGLTGKKKKKSTGYLSSRYQHASKGTGYCLSVCTPAWQGSHSQLEGGVGRLCRGRNKHIISQQRPLMAARRTASTKIGRRLQDMECQHAFKIDLGTADFSLQGHSSKVKQRICAESPIIY